MKKITDPSFKYVPVAEQRPDYLRRKFAQMRREQKAEIQRRLDRIVSLPERKKAHG